MSRVATGDPPSAPELTMVLAGSKPAPGSIWAHINAALSELIDANRQLKMGGKAARIRAGPPRLPSRTAAHFASHRPCTSRGGWHRHSTASLATPPPTALLPLPHSTHTRSPAAQAASRPVRGVRAARSLAALADSQSDTRRSSRSAGPLGSPHWAGPHSAGPLGSCSRQVNAAASAVSEWPSPTPDHSIPVSHQVPCHWARVALGRPRP